MWSEHTDSVDLRAYRRRDYPASASCQRPGSTFGTVNADVLAHFDDSFVREDFVEVIRNNSWPQ